MLPARRTYTASIPILTIRAMYIPGISHSHSKFTVPIVPGLKPISKASQLTLLPRVFHVDIPDMLVREIVKCKDDSQVKQVGIDWCTAQSLELKAKGVPSIHYYSLMAVDSVYQVAKSVY